MTYQFRIQLAGVENPPVWRQITVPSDFTFSQFHWIIQAAFGWDCSHLYQFCEKGWNSKTVIADEETVEMDDSDAEMLVAEEVKLSDIFKRKGKKFNYLYDFGDEWWHNIVLEQIIKDDTKSAICLAGEGACPPEDCGGPWGYADLKHIMKDKNHPDYDEFRDWLGLDEEEEFLPEEIDLDDIQMRVKAYSQEP